MYATTLAARGISSSCVLSLALMLASCGGSSGGSTSTSGGGSNGGGSTPTYYSIDGTVLGLSGTGLVLQNNGGNNFPVPANGAFSFSAPSGAAYAVTVLAQPANPDQTCTIANGTGTVGTANVTDISVSCTTTGPLVQKTDLIYRGAFRVPQGATDATSFSYGGTSLGHNPGNNSIYLTGHDQYQLTAEIGIPSPVISTDVNDLATASLLQPFADPTEGKLSQINSQDPNPQKIGGHLVYGGKLIVTGYSFYDGSGTQSASHFSRPLSLSLASQVGGPYQAGSDPHFVDGYMTLVPPEWQPLLGGPALTGMCCLSIASVQSNGPAVAVFDPSKLGQINPVPAKQLLGYPLAHPLRDVSSTNPYFNLATKINGVVFAPGTRSVLFFGRQGTGTYCYGPGTSDPTLAGTMSPDGVDPWCYDPADSYKGPHAYPYQYQVWAYDANDLLSVKNGSKLMHAIQPYAIWSFSLPFEESTSSHLIGGAAYDPQTTNIYVSQKCEDVNCAPIIHVFSVAKATPTGP